MENEKKSTQSARETKLQLIEALRDLPKTDFRKVVKATRQLRLADAIASRAIGGVDE